MRRAEEWPVTLTVPAPADRGFMILKSKVFKTSLTLKIPAGAKMKPTDVVAVWKLIDADVPAGQAAVMLWCDPAMGKVKGTGLYKLALDKKTGVWTKKVSIGATAAKDYVFAGWYEDLGFATPVRFWTGSGKSLKEPLDEQERTGSPFAFAKLPSEKVPNYLMKERQIT